MEEIINDFTINIATANGTGSQSANLILLQTLYDMGLPVSGKNLFPSNISGPIIFRFRDCLCPHKTQLSASELINSVQFLHAICYGLSFHSINLNFYSHRDMVHLKIITCNRQIIVNSISRF